MPQKWLERLEQATKLLEVPLPPTGAAGTSPWPGELWEAELAEGRHAVSRRRETTAPLAPSVYDVEREFPQRNHERWFQGTDPHWTWVCLKLKWQMMFLTWWPRAESCFKRLLLDSSS